MSKITLIASVLLFTAVHAFAQKEFKITKSGGKLAIKNIANLKVIGYEGKEIIFLASGPKEKVTDPRAAGLSALSNSGFDNTGIGLSVIDKDNITTVSPIAKNISLTVKLPQGIALSIKTSGLMQGDSTSIMISDIKSEIDASTQYENLNLKNVTGPVSLKTLYGNIEGKLTPSFKGPISLISVYGFIDVTVPESTKADMSISTQYETLYAAKDLKLVINETPVKDSVYVGTNLSALTTKVNGKNVQTITINGNSITTPNIKGNGTITSTTTSNGNVVVGQAIGEKDASRAKKSKIIDDLSYTYNFAAPLTLLNSSGGSTVNGKLNGGGEKIILKSTYGKIYLRK